MSGLRKKAAKTATKSRPEARRCAAPARSRRRPRQHRSGAAAPRRRRAPPARRTPPTRPQPTLPLRSLQRAGQTRPARPGRRSSPGGRRCCARRRRRPACAAAAPACRSRRRRCRAWPRLKAISQNTASVSWKKCGAGSGQRHQRQRGADRRTAAPRSSSACVPSRSTSGAPQRLDHPRQVEPARVERDVGVGDAEVLVHHHRQRHHHHVGQALGEVERRDPAPGTHARTSWSSVSVPCWHRA